MSTVSILCIARQAVLGKRRTGICIGTKCNRQNYQSEDKCSSNQTLYLVAIQFSSYQTLNKIVMAYVQYPTCLKWLYYCLCSES